MISLDQVLEDARRGHRALDREHAARLLLAAIRVAAGAEVSLRPHALLLNEEGGLELGAAADEDRPGYVAPEVAAGLTTAEDPQALVYSAGALAYELFTLNPVPDRRVPAGPELPEPLAAVLRRALSPRHRRFQNLWELEVELSSLGGGAEDPARAPRAGAVRSQPPRPPAQAPSTPTQPTAEIEEAEKRIAELTRTLSDQQEAAEKRLGQLQGTIDALEERVQLLTWIANAGARTAPAREPAAQRSASSRRRSRLLGSVGVTLLVVAAIAAAILVIRGDGLTDGASRRPAPRDAATPSPRAATGEPPPAPLRGPAEPAAQSAPAPADDVKPTRPASEPSEPRQRAAGSPPAGRHRANAVELGRRDPEQAWAHAESGMRALEAGRTADAVAELQAAISIDPALVSAQRGLADAYLKAGEPEAARAHYEAYLRLAPHASDAKAVRKLIQGLPARRP